LIMLGLGRSERFRGDAFFWHGGMM
jgi:hypothetical protein